MVELEIDLDSDAIDQPLYEGDDLIDLRTSVDIQPGDLVEISSSAWRIQILAVCLGEFNGYYHYYTNTGKWFTTHGFRSLFTVRAFACRSEIQPVIDALPSTSASIALLNTLQDLKAGPSRDIGAALIRKMNGFQAKSRSIYLENAGKLDNAFQVLAGDETILSLAAIAQRLLPTNLSRQGRFPPEALYAVHLALGQDEAGFRPASRLGHVQSYLFEISSQHDVALLQKVESIVQKYQADSLRVLGRWSDDFLQKSFFGQFVLKARKAIDNSRRSRAWSPYGMLKESAESVSPILPGWSGADFDIIAFLNMWAATKKFGVASRHHAVGATILRALDRYHDSEYLDESVAWTFLQEIGWIKPWEIQARYGLRLPGVQLERGGGVKWEQRTPAKAGLTEDVFGDHRRDWRTLRAFCIDAETATDIDDGVSLERTKNEGEFWVRVHVADPASAIRPDSGLANHSAAMMQTVYLPGHFARMFPDSGIRDRFSLAPSRPCLTFSAKVNSAGAILDYDITPGYLRNVVYMTGEDVAEVCGEQLDPVVGPSSQFSVGRPPTSAAPSPDRPMSKPEDLGDDDKSTLRTLSQLAKALRARRLQNGAMPAYLPTPSVDVSFEDVEVINTPDGFIHCSGDPYIKVHYNRSSNNQIIDATMQLAGEIAARWCHERGIPIPFRVQPRASKNKELLRRYTEEIFYPLLASGKRPSDEHWRIIRALSGGYDISTTPTPHFAMGIDMYTKATSPLRRYVDLLVHWQIEAALLEERVRGGRGSLIGNTDDSFLPFNRVQLEQEVFPLLRLRERHANLLDRSHGPAEWILQALVRAWRFGEPVAEGSSVLPEIFRFTVTDVIEKRAVKGRLDWFERAALMESSGLEGAIDGGVPLLMKDINVGDVFEVVLSDVNVYKKRIMVKALRRVERLEPMRFA
ncbi:hypothetical protein VTK73DRAFT_6217 [Phialemonium thermophilum]|uniref:RNB domain-containing protein n=1 Tax=Phialemonium thermophilum TaxID=223376 RepID=A0ABR3XW04_9PEZI